MTRWLIRVSVGWGLAFSCMLSASAQEARTAGSDRIGQSITTEPPLSLKPFHENTMAEGSQLAAYRAQVIGYQQQLLAAQQQFNGWRDDLMAQQALLDQRDAELEQAVRQRVQRREAPAQRARTISERVSAARHGASLAEWQQELAQFEKSADRWQTSVGAWRVSIERWSTAAKRQHKAFEVMSAYIASLSQELPALQQVPFESLTAEELVLSVRAVWKKSEELAQEMAVFLRQVQDNRAALIEWQQSIRDTMTGLSDCDQSLAAWGQRLDAWEQWIVQQSPVDAGAAAVSTTPRGG